MNVFFFGLGYSSLATARAIHELIDPTATMAGTRRSEEGCERLAESPYRLHVFDGVKPGETLAADLRAATHVILSIPPGEDGDPALNLHRADLDAASDLRWLCYFSTVGVYGDFAGAWIDETASTRPLNARSEHRVAAEAAWRDYAAARGLPLLILRLAGIYGPGRSSFDKLREGTARRIVKPGQVFNRIHVDDIGQVTALAAKAKLAGTFNLSDDEPAPPQDLVEYAARKMGVPVPPDVPFEEAQMNEMARSFYADNKRVSSAAIRKVLGVRLLFPNYRAGLDAIYELPRMSAPKPANGAPQREVLDGRYARLEPLGQVHVPDLWASVEAVRFRWLFDEPPETEAEMDQWIATAAAATDRVYFAVIDKASGRAEGRQALMNIVPAHGSIEVGGVYWGPRLARTRAATEALFLHARYVFDTLGYRRFEWKCNDRNLPSKAAARRFGFEFEGVFRQHMVIKGENRDTAWFSMLDREWPAIRAEYERWLDPENFDDAGTQRTTLQVSPSRTAS